uniref:KRAB-A domain-containing protein 2 n=1 Tax=Schizaphis graminum TaxID=13262 RepID=A0A2S2PCC0_SCHGA
MENMRELFYNKFNDLIFKKRNDNSFFLSAEKYKFLISEVNISKDKSNKKRNDYRRLKRYDVLNILGSTKLIVPLKPGETNIKYYVKNEELFDIIQQTHIQTGHGGHTRMIKELQCKYKNITYEIVMLYLSLCIQCQIKQKAPIKGIVVKPIVSSESNLRCQIDLVDMQTCKDGEYKFILNYQDQLRKFIQLRPLKSKTAEEVAHNLLHIFLTFGAPNILHSDNGREFVNKIITELCLMWYGVKIVHGKPCHNQTQGSIESESRYSKPIKSMDVRK